MADTPKHSVSVAGVVVREDGRILMIQRRDNSHWEPPGGVLELSETFEEGVRREVQEETGVDIKVDQLTGVYKNLSRGIVALVFRCRPLNHPTMATDEARSIAWLSVEEVTQQMDQAYSVRVTDALNNGGPITRSHNGVNLVST